MNLLVIVLGFNKSLKLAKSVVSVQPHQAAQAQLQCLSLVTVYTPLLAWCRQCQRRPLSVDPNLHAKRSSPQTAGNLNISNYTLLNTFKLHTRRIWQFSACFNALDLLSIWNSMLRQIQSKTWPLLPRSNMLEASQTRSLNHHYLLWKEWKYTPASVLRRPIGLRRYANITFRVALKQTYKTISNTHLRRVKSTILIWVGSSSRVWRFTMAMCWEKNTLLCVSQATTTEMASTSLWLPY